jgi:hypothetical protein
VTGYRYEYVDGQEFSSVRNHVFKIYSGTNNINTYTAKLTDEYFNGDSTKDISVNGKRPIVECEYEIAAPIVASTTATGLLSSITISVDTSVAFP